jgi:hypothetical protein
MVGLTTAADFYGIGVILLPVGSLAATMSAVKGQQSVHRVDHFVGVAEHLFACRR